ncbi:SERTA domain-containing protein 1-like [Mobula hypostoma]|uniref:SERTA domain-containing protein 1-like n=1 Tax=Mobula hypostoma TaxID=723540 RepID=UPI002FC2E0C9
MRDESALTRPWAPSSAPTLDFLLPPAAPQGRYEPAALLGMPVWPGGPFSFCSPVVCVRIETGVATAFSCISGDSERLPLPPSRAKLRAGHSARQRAGGWVDAEAAEQPRGAATCRGIAWVESMAAVRFTPGKGLKRKRGEDDAAPPTPLAFQCDSLLDLSLLKLQQSCAVAECNLRRSVLIANALRRLQAEGLPPQAGSAPQLQPPAQAAPKPEGVDQNNNPAQADLGLLSGNDSSLSSAISSILQDLDYAQGLSPAREQASAEDDQLQPARPGSPGSRPLDSIFATFEITESDAFLVDGSLDAIFEDIDTSMYDTQPALSAALWEPIKPMPAPVAAFPPCPLAKAPCDRSSSRAPSGRTDFADIESVMDLLVG